MSYSDDALLACVPQIQSTLPLSKLLQCAGRKTNIVAVKTLDSYRSFRPTTTAQPMRMIADVSATKGDAFTGPPRGWP